MSSAVPLARGRDLSILIPGRLGFPHSRVAGILSNRAPLGPVAIAGLICRDPRVATKASTYSTGIESLVRIAVFAATSRTAKRSGRSAGASLERQLMFEQYGVGQCGPGEREHMVMVREQHDLGTRRQFAKDGQGGRSPPVVEVHEDVV